MVRQRWGQNYLVDGAVAARVVEALGAASDDRVIEVGPGRGALTRFLAGRTRELFLVELDRRWVDLLDGRWGKTPGVSVARADFLEWPFPDGPEGGALIIGNLPYSAANAILRRFLDWPGWRRAVVMVQKEAALRMTARPGGGDYGLLSLAVQGKAVVEALFDVPPSRFRPRPQVMSTVLRLTRRPAPLIRRDEVFFQTARAAFGQRRKTVLNALAHGLDRGKREVEETLLAAKIDPSRRPETLSLEEFNTVADGLFPAG